MQKKPPLDFGKESICKGENCKKPVIFIDVIVKDKLRRVCLDAEAVPMYVPYYDKVDEKNTGAKRPVRWSRKYCYRTHRDLCVNAADFDKGMIAAND